MSDIRIKRATKARVTEATADGRILAPGEMVFVTDTDSKELLIGNNTAPNASGIKTKDAKNVTETIDGKAIIEIFEENGKTVKNATNAVNLNGTISSATTATTQAVTDNSTKVATTQLTSDKINHSTIVHSGRSGVHISPLLLTQTNPAEDRFFIITGAFATDDNSTLLNFTHTATVGVNQTSISNVQVIGPSHPNISEDFLICYKGECEIKNTSSELSVFFKNFKCLKVDNTGAFGAVVFHDLGIEVRALFVNVIALKITSHT